MAPGDRRIRLLLIAGRDWDAAYAHALHTYLEPESFQVTAVVPEDAGLRDARILSLQGVLALRRTKRVLVSLARQADVVDLHGFLALRAGMLAGLWQYPTVYTRTVIPAPGAATRQESWFMSRADAVIALGPALVPADARAMVLDLATAPKPPSLPSRHDARRKLGLSEDAVAALVWVRGPGSMRLSGPILHGLEGVTVLWSGPGRPPGAADVPSVEAGLAASDMVVLPEPASVPVLSVAMAAGVAVVTARSPDAAARVHCPIDALLVSPDDDVAWQETCQAVAQDEEWRRNLGAAARRWSAVQGPAGQIRVAQGIYASVLERRTGRCPVCPPELDWRRRGQFHVGP